MRGDSNDSGLGSLPKISRAGRLGSPDVLAAQLDRMLADTRTSRFVDGFTRQWP